jgi:hypothetical protein
MTIFVDGIVLGRLPDRVVVFDPIAVLPFNVSHFARMSGFGPGIVVIGPTTV